MKTTDQIVTIDVKPFLLPVSILLSAVILSGSLLMSATTLARGGVGLAAGGSGSTTSAGAVAGTREVEFTVNIDDDPILGNKESGLAIIEFAAYDCPYCDRHFQEVYPKLKEQYVDTGKAFMVYRDSPLSGPTQLQANAAECVRKQGGDAAYFKMHDFLFEKFYADAGQTSRTSWTPEIVKSFVDSIGYDGAAVASCAEKLELQEEIQKDQSDLSALASQLGVGGLGVPSFVIGRVDSNGNVTGKVTVDGATGQVVPNTGALINGALPLETFVAEINKLL